MPDLYADPLAYELAFASRDIEREGDFLVEAARRSLGRVPVSSIELGAGPALHSRYLAARGLRATALDREPGAAAYLARVAPNVHTLVAEMTDFAVSEPADIIFCPLATFAYLLTDEAALECLASCAAALAPRGLLCLELLPLDAHRAAASEWSAKGEGASVEAWAGPSRWVASDVYEWTLRLTLHRETVATVFEGVQRQRFLTAAVLERLVRRTAGLTEVRLYADWDARRRWRGELAYVACAARRP